MDVFLELFAVKMINFYYAFIDPIYISNQKKYAFLQGFFSSISFTDVNSDQMLYSTLPSGSTRKFLGGGHQGDNMPLLGGKIPKNC